MVVDGTKAALKGGIKTVCTVAHSRSVQYVVDRTKKGTWRSLQLIGEVTVTATNVLMIANGMPVTMTTLTCNIEIIGEIPYSWDPWVSLKKAMRLLPR